MIVSRIECYRKWSVRTKSKRSLGGRYVFHLARVLEHELKNRQSRSDNVHFAFKRYDRLDVSLLLCVDTKTILPDANFKRARYIGFRTRISADIIDSSYTVTSQSPGRAHSIKHELNLMIQKKKKKELRLTRVITVVPRVFSRTRDVCRCCYFVVFSLTPRRRR